jgi:5-methylthioadenosine/S-adenosylhomocysteine deaminase
LRPVVDGVGIMVHSGNGSNVRSVICNGELILDDRQPTRFNLDDVIADAQSVVDTLWQRASNHA